MDTRNATRVITRVEPNLHDQWYRSTHVRIISSQTESGGNDSSPDKHLASSLGGELERLVDILTHLRPSLDCRVDLRNLFWKVSERGQGKKRRRLGIGGKEGSAIISPRDFCRRDFVDLSRSCLCRQIITPSHRPFRSAEPS